MKRLTIIVVAVMLSLTLLSGCSGDSSDVKYKEALKKAEDFKKLNLTDKFKQLSKETRMLESRALLGAPTVELQDKLGEQLVTVYIWNDKEGNEVGAAFVENRLAEKLTKEQIEFFKKNQKEAEKASEKTPEKAQETTPKKGS